MPKLYDLAAQELDCEEAILLEQHLAECPRCRAEQEALETILITRAEAEEWTPDLEDARRLFASVAPGIGRSEDDADRAVRELSPARRAQTSGTLRARLSSLAGFVRRPLPSYAAAGLLVAGILLGTWTGGSGGVALLARRLFSDRPSPPAANELPAALDGGASRAGAPQASPLPGSLAPADSPTDSLSPPAERYSLADASAARATSGWDAEFVTVCSDAIRLESPSEKDSL